MILYTLLYIKNRQRAPCRLLGVVVGDGSGSWVMTSTSGHPVASVLGRGGIFQAIQAGGATPNSPVWRRSLAEG